MKQGKSPANHFFPGSHECSSLQETKREISKKSDGNDVQGEKTIGKKKGCTAFLCTCVYVYTYRGQMSLTRAVLVTHQRQLDLSGVPDHPSAKLTRQSFCWLYGGCRGAEKYLIWYKS